MPPIDIRSIAKAEFDKLNLPPGEANTMLAWHFWKRAFDVAWGCFQEEQTCNAGISTDYVPKVSESYERLKKVGLISKELHLAHGVTLAPKELMFKWSVTGDETPLEIWELSERIKKSLAE